ncbi:hypothetical protein ACFHW2_09310 [Actinomadura sp. LOL_016]|uniref:hypothetical protein n=1 Tax=unclassified Actinomadura TaxID=2626254 RepID=UPI003A7F99F3
MPGDRNAGTPHTGDGPGKGVIVVNPGGPGGGGALFGPRVFARNSPEMQAACDAIGFDRCGVGMSEPALSCDETYTDAPRAALLKADVIR